MLIRLVIFPSNNNNLYWSFFKMDPSLAKLGSHASHLVPPTQLHTYLIIWMPE